MVPGEISPTELAAMKAVVVDLARSIDYRDGHIPGALWGIRTRLASLSRALAGARLIIRAKTKDRKLFGSIDAAGVAVAIAKKGIVGVTERNIVLPKPIKETGEFPVEANFGTAKAKFLVAVEAEG